MSSGSSPRPTATGRTCRQCEADLSRRYPDQPLVNQGYCWRCGTPFTISQPRQLRAGDVVDDRYEIISYVAHGGLGRVYLAEDRHLSGVRVALKGLIDTEDGLALALQVAEREFLIALDHPNIVRITNFVTHRDPGTDQRTGFIVMEYLDGESLRQIRDDAHARREPLPLEQVISYGDEILAALDYLHGRGLLYCDMKPDNVIRCEDRVKVVDLGGVRRLGDSDYCARPLVFTPGFLVPDKEIQTNGLSVQSDLYAVGKTLRELFEATAESLSAGDTSPVSLGIESFRRAMCRATHQDWTRRFGSAVEMAEQLRGVARELVALRGGAEQPERSTRFAPTAALLDAGLGAVPPLEQWTRAGSSGALDAGRPPAESAAVRLPTPRVATDDPAAQLLEGAPDPASVIEKLPVFEPGSVDVQLAGCRAYLELARKNDAAGCLAEAERLLGDRAARDWRVAWHHGLLALAGDDIEAARSRFDSVYKALPGETAPKLALGFCAECGASAERSDLRKQAERYYRAVWLRDRSQASAAFGLARVRLSVRDRAGAVEILDGVPPTSRHRDAAQIAAVRVQFGQLGDAATGLPDVEEVREAERRLSSLRLDGGTGHGETRNRLIAALREVALEVVRGEKTRRLAGRGRVLGDSPDERAMRDLLETSFHTLAQQARSADDHGVLVDRANEVRPRTLR